MKIRLTLLLAAVAIIAFAHAETQKSDSELLQGKWQGTEKDASPDGGTSLLTVSGKIMEFHGADTNDWVTGTFTLREDVTPKQLVVTIKDCPDSGSIGKPIYVIYRLERDTFTAAGNSPGETNFPSGFDAAGVRQIVFKRK